METLDYEESIDDFKRRIFDLNTMLDIGKTLNASLSLEDVLDIIILTCSGHFHSSDAIILLYSEKSNTPQFIYNTEEEVMSIECSDPLIKFINDNQRVLEKEELKNIPGCKKVYDRFDRMEVELIVPLSYKGRINGILCLKQKEEEFGSVYTEDEKQYVGIIAGFGSVAIENARLYEIATIDLKTKLYNHGFFQNRLIEEIERSERYKTDLTLLMIDLDHFKNVNDTYGHMVGDNVLIKVADTIKHHIRAFDVPARFGGEEFTIILPETSTDDTLIVAERLRKSIEKLSFPISDGNKKVSDYFNITVSIGFARYIHSASMTDDIIIDNADRAMYHAKEHGRNQVVFYDNIKEIKVS